MAKHQKSLLFLTALLMTTGVFLFSVSHVQARELIDIDLGMDLNALIADHVNDLAGHRIVGFVPYSLAGTAGANANSATASNSQLSIQKTGKNISKGQNAEQFNLTASPNDTLEFVIRIRSLSSSVLNNVTIRDILPGGLAYINRTTGINGTITVDGIAGSGINIGSLYPNQETVISFSATVGPATAFPIGISQLVNQVGVISDGASAVTAQLPISVTNGQAAGQVAGVSTIAQVAGVSTGTTGSLALSTALSLLIALSYMAYTQTGLFKKREALAIIQKHRSDKNRFNFIS